MGLLSEAGKVLVLNAGSSSLKFKLFSLAPTFAAGVGGMIDRIGDTVNSNLVAKDSSGSSVKKWTEKVPIKDHVEAMEAIMAFMGDNVSKSIHREVAAVGHRVVHGLDIHQAVLLDDPVIEKIKQAASLAPLHNPPGLQGISAAMEVFKGIPQVSCSTQVARHEAMQWQRQFVAAFVGLAWHMASSCNAFTWLLVQKNAAWTLAGKHFKCATERSDCNTSARQYTTTAAPR